ncbi:MAG: alpha-N-acetylglucosaminidase [Bacteroidales bacterium]|nr:alpha-N-acetylglucosaminidase [Bacteroidales bacterium]
MKKIFFLLISITFCLSCSEKREVSPETDAAYGLAERVLGEKAGRICFELLADETEDVFELSSEGRRIVIRGNNANSMAVGLNHYLRYHCNSVYSWFDYEEMTLPKRLPKIEGTIRHSARVKDRFFLNYCTYGYTMPWWKWEEWEHFIDWMALNGVNMALAITGQESIWYQIWTEMGLSDEEVRAYFCGPAHLPWHRMINLDRWNGPLPKAWLDGQEELQKQIVARERELGIRPILPAFSGHVPAELARIYPDAPIKELKPWEHFPADCACSLLDPMSDLFSEIQKKFIKRQAEVYGTDHIYGIDLFNEVTPPSWEPEYLSRVSRQVYESLKAADEEAVWLQMAWLFFYGKANWTPERIEAYLTSFPKERQLLLDYHCENTEVWQQTDSFYGVPYIWNYLGNFGGNSHLTGSFRVIDERFENALVNGGSNLSGIGCTLEAMDCNPYVFEYVLEKAWDFSIHHDVEAWINAMSDRRTGKVDENARQAWQHLANTIYVDERPTGLRQQMLNFRPVFNDWAWTYNSPALDEDTENLRIALDLMLEADGSGAAYGFDVTNIARQYLTNVFNAAFRDYEVAVKDGKREDMAAKAELMLRILDDLEVITGTQAYFLAGKWIEDARSWGTTPEEEDYYEREARNLITTWAGKAHQSLNDYARRTCNGLISSYYKPRWEKFFKDVAARMDSGKGFHMEQYMVYKDEITDFEMQWWQECIGDFISEPAGDSKDTVRKIIKSY